MPLPMSPVTNHGPARPVPTEVCAGAGGETRPDPDCGRTSVSLFPIAAATIPSKRTQLRATPDTRTLGGRQ